MSDQLITIEMTEKQLATAISGLLLSCSVNVVSTTHQEYLSELFQLAKLFKTVKPDIKLTEIQFIEDTNYEDSLSSEVMEAFDGNVEVITFAEV